MMKIKELEDASIGAIVLKSLLRNRLKVTQVNSRSSLTTLRRVITSMHTEDEPHGEISRFDSLCQGRMRGAHRSQYQLFKQSRWIEFARNVREAEPTLGTEPLLLNAGEYGDTW